jgi:hypothetical protein
MSKVRCEMEMGWERDTFTCEVRGGEGEMNEMRVQKNVRVVSEGNEGDIKMDGVFVAGEDGKDMKRICVCM